MNKNIGNILLAVLFFVFAWVQINDPDPLAWVTIYSVVGVFALYAIFKPLPYFLPLAGIGVCIVWIILLLPEFINWLQMGAPSITESMKAEKPHVEYTREFLGLFICGVAFSFLYFQARKRQAS